MPIRVDKCTSNITLSLEKVKYFSKGKRKLLNLIIWFQSKNALVFPNCDTLASMVGLTPNYVSKLTSELQSEGLITKDGRHMRSNIYWLCPELYNFWLRVSLLKYLPALKYIVLSVGMMLSEHSLTKIVDEHIKGIYLEGCEIQMKLVIPSKLMMNDVQIQHLQSYDDKIIDYAWLKFLEKKKTIPEDAYSRYFLGICRNRQKFLSGKAVENMLKSGIAESSVVPKIPEKERSTQDFDAPMSPILAPPPANKPTITQVTQYVSDNFGLKQSTAGVIRHKNKLKNEVSWSVEGTPAVSTPADQAFEFFMKLELEKAQQSKIAELESQGLSIVADLLRGNWQQPPIEKPAVSIETTGDAEEELWWSLQECVDENCDESANFI